MKSIKSNRDTRPIYERFEDVKRHKQERLDKLKQEIELKAKLQDPENHGAATHRP